MFCDAYFEVGISHVCFGFHTISRQSRAGRFPGWADNSDMLDFKGHVNF